MKKISKNSHHHVSRRITLFTMLGLLAVPASGSAAISDSTAPAPATADPDCGKSQIQLEVDVTTGNVYEVDPNTGNLTLIDNDIDAYFGSLGHVVVALHYSTSNWNVTIIPEGKSPVTYRTTNGWLRYSISDEISKYTFVSTQQSSMSAMSSMTPVVPDIVIRPKPDCPPPT